MSAPDYVQILLKLHELLEISITRVNEERRSVDMSIQAYRERIIEIFVEESERYLDLLPQETRSSALVTLKDYGRRNREDIIRRIKRGDFPKSREAEFD